LVTEVDALVKISPGSRADENRLKSGVRHIRLVGKRLLKLHIRFEALGVQQGLRDFPAETQAKGQVRVYPPGIVDIARPFAGAKICLGQRYRDDGVVGIAQQEVRARVAAGSAACGRDLVGVLAIEIKLAAGEFVSHLRKL